MSAQLYRFRDFTEGDFLVSQFADALRGLLDDARFEKLSTAQVVGAMEVVKLELILRLHGAI